MEPIFDRRGRPVGWLQAHVIYDRNGRGRAWLQEGTLYTYGGEYLGTFERGFFRDRQGHAVAFVQGAEGEPPTPITAFPPVPPTVRVAPVPRLPPPAPTPPVPSRHWSPVSWEDYVSGASPRQPSS
jgi:hypothetical protein